MSASGHHLSQAASDARATAPAPRSPERAEDSWDNPANVVAAPPSTLGLRPRLEASHSRPALGWRRRRPTIGPRATDSAHYWPTGRTEQGTTEPNRAVREPFSARPLTRVKALIRPSELKAPLGRIRSCAHGSGGRCSISHIARASSDAHKSRTRPARTVSYGFPRDETRVREKRHLIRRDAPRASRTGRRSGGS